EHFHRMLSTRVSHQFNSLITLTGPTQSIWPPWLRNATRPLYKAFRIRSQQSSTSKLDKRHNIPLSFLCQLHPQLQAHPIRRLSQSKASLQKSSIPPSSHDTQIDVSSTSEDMQSTTTQQLPSRGAISRECIPKTGGVDTSILPTPANTPSTTPDFAMKLAKHNLTEADLQNVHDLLIDIAKAGGKIMMEAEHEFLIAAAAKNNTADLVTQYDKQIEETVEHRVLEAYPTFDFLGEESFKHGQKLANRPTFVVDPIDGTLNFSKGVPNSAVSLALTVDKKPVVGIVYNPFRGDMYTAIKNRGAFLTKMHTGARFKLPLQPVPPPMPSLRFCLVAVEWGNQRHGPNWELRTDIHKKLLTDKKEGGAFCKSIRSNGSAALDFCYVAQGMLDCFWEGGVWIWDVAAGWCILEEAGGIVASANPGDWDPTLEGRLYFAVRHAKREEQKAIVDELWDIMGDRKFVY
ncbi:inositol-1-monophosphatase, partial [Parastagonospora nodorum SN15]